MHKRVEIMISLILHLVNSTTDKDIEKIRIQGINKKNNTMNYDIVALYVFIDDFSKIYEECEKKADRSNKMQKQGR